MTNVTVNNIFSTIETNLNKGRLANINVFSGVILLHHMGETRPTIDARMTASGHYRGVSGTWHKLAKQFAKDYVLDMPIGTASVRINLLATRLIEKAQSRADSLSLAVSVQVICDVLEGKECIFEQAITEGKISLEEIKISLENIPTEKMEDLGDSLKTINQFEEAVNTCKKNKAGDKIKGLIRNFNRAIKHIEEMETGLELESQPIMESDNFLAVIGVIQGLEDLEAIEKIIEVARNQYKAIESATSKEQEQELKAA